MKLYDTLNEVRPLLNKRLSEFTRESVSLPKLNNPFRRRVSDYFKEVEERDLQSCGSRV
jgi:hypothetical protein